MENSTILNDAELTRIPLGNNISTCQKCYLSSSLLETLNPQYHPKSYALLRFSSKCQYICRVAWDKQLQSGFFRMSNSVVTFKQCHQTKDGLPCEPIQQSCNTISVGNIKLISSVNNLKSLSVTVVFKDVKSIGKWKDNIFILVPIVKSILQMYIVAECTVVSLNDLEDTDKFGIHLIIIHRVTGCTNGDSYLGRINNSTKLCISKLMSKIRYEHHMKSQSILELGGLSGPYQAVKEIIDHHSLLSKGKHVKICHQVLLIGPSGCGKTSLVHKIASDCGAVLVTILGPEVYSPKPGDTEQRLRNVFKEAKYLSEEGMTIILLDEIDVLCRKREKASSHTARAASQLLSLLEKIDGAHNLVVIATTNRPFDLDPAVRRPGRLEIEVYIGVPTEQQRKEILYIQVRPMLSPNFEHIAELCSEIARMTPGYVGADLSLICQDVAFQQYKKKKNSEKTTFSEWIGEFRAAVGRIRPSALRSGLGVVVTSPVSLAEIGGLEEIKRTLKAAVEWPLLYPEAFSRFGLRQPRGILLYGPPGCAKTRLARALASTTNTTFLCISAAELYSPFVGDAEKNVLELFHRARLGAPTILFVDEIDALVGSRSVKGKHVQERVLSAFLTEMDGITTIENHPETSVTKEIRSAGIIVIAATNRPDILDDALLRPGRFDKLIYVPPPDTQSRLNILKICLANTPISSCVDLLEIAEKTELYSGADIKSLCREAALHALTESCLEATEVTHLDFLCALDQLRPSLTKSQIQWYKNYSASCKKHIP